MTPQSIDHSTLLRLVEAGAVRDTHVVGLNGGWKVVVEAGNAGSYTLTAQRRGQARVFKKLETLIGYLKGIGIAHFAVDAAAFAPQPHARPDRSAALRQTHEAAEHDRWFRDEVAAGLHHADGPQAVWIDNADARKDWAGLRAELLARSQTARHGA